MRVAVDQLLDDRPGDVVDGERLLLRSSSRDPRVEDDLEQYVPELLAQLVAVAVLDRLDEFVRLLDAVLGEALVGLLRGPGAFAPDPVHDLDEVEQPGAGQVVRAGQQLQVRHLHPARPGEPGQPVGERPGRPRRRGQRPRRSGRRRRRRPAPARWARRSRRRRPPRADTAAAGGPASAHSTRSAACSVCQAGQDSSPGATRWLAVSRTIRPGATGASVVTPRTYLRATPARRSAGQARPVDGSGSCADLA